MKDARSAFIADITATPEEVTLRAPFVVTTESKRRFIRIEVAEPVTFELVKPHGGQFYPSGSGAYGSGATVNLSETGVLMDSDKVVPEGTILSLTVTMQGRVQANGILAVVKRVDELDGRGLLGMEFIGRPELLDKLSSGEMEMLDTKFNRFEMQIQRAIAEYVAKGAKS